MTYSEAVARAAAKLAAGGFAIVDAEADAAVLARHILNCDLAHWLSHMRDEADADFIADLETAIARRATREPVAYITEQREFYGRPFIVDGRVLIPRPETELIVDAALGTVEHRDSYSGTICDIGTGSGCIAITLALELPKARVIATDISRDAIFLTLVNSATLGADALKQISLGAFFADSTDLFDLIVSNPPYVSTRDRDTLMPDVVDFEPEVALFSGEDGLDCIRELVRLAPERLKAGGKLIFEFGFGQSDGVRALFESSPLKLVEIKNDLQGIPRVAVATV
jgi:release factor glutamine methyltransferase